MALLTHLNLRIEDDLVAYQLIQKKKPTFELFDTELTVRLLTATDISHLIDAYAHAFKTTSEQALAHFQRSLLGKQTNFYILVSSKKEYLGAIAVDYDTYLFSLFIKQENQQTGLGHI